MLIKTTREVVDVDLKTLNPDKSHKPKILLSSVFGPYAVDDIYGSRKINPMELYHNQVTRVQGPFSLRLFHRSWGLMLIQANIESPCHVLDFPTLDRFIEEIQNNQYDVIGISAIMPNTRKVKTMCDLVREYQPDAVIVVGGHISNVPDLPKRIDADHIVKGDGIIWFRQFLGEDIKKPINHPIELSGFGGRAFGASMGKGFKNTAAVLIPSVGCPLGCNFCSTSAMFGGKGKFVNFYETGEELFDVMNKIATATGAMAFFVMDENFLLHKKRALRLLELMEERQKSWSLYVFASANVIQSYTIEQLVGLGISWVWMGLEGKDSQYQKLNGSDTFDLVKHLQSHGIRVLGSSIIGLESHTPENIGDAIDYAVKHNTDFHQFMLYTPIPGTPFYKECQEKGIMLPEDICEFADSHGQLKFNYNHQFIKNGLETELLVRAFERDLEKNGPSVVRLASTTLKGWKRYKNHPNPRIRKRFEYDAKGLVTSFGTAAWVSEKWHTKGNPGLASKMRDFKNEIYTEFGMLAKIGCNVLGPILYRLTKHEDKKLKRGSTYEPKTFYEANYANGENRKLGLAKTIMPA